MIRIEYVFNSLQLLENSCVKTELNFKTPRTATPINSKKPMISQQKKHLSAKPTTAVYRRQNQYPNHPYGQQLIIPPRVQLTTLFQSKISYVRRRMTD